MNALQEIRRTFQWKMDHVNDEIRREAADMADDAAGIKAAVDKEFNIGGFDHTRAARGARLDVAIAKRALLAEMIGQLDYAIKAEEAEAAL